MPNPYDETQPDNSAEILLASWQSITILSVLTIIIIVLIVYLVKYKAKADALESVLIDKTVISKKEQESKKETLNQLETLNKLKKSGAISNNEFEEQKKVILK